MNIEHYMNVNYVPGTFVEYRKVIFLIEGGQRGVFSVTERKDNGHVEIQRFFDVDKEKAYRFIVGNNPHLITFNDIRIREMKKCFEEIYKSANYFMQLKKFTQTEQVEILQYMNNVLSEYCKAFDKSVEKNNGTVEEVKAETDEWTVFDADSITQKEIAEIMQLISENGVNDEGVVYKGRKYRIHKVNDEYMIEVSAAKNEAKPVHVESVFSGNVRKFIQMAKIVNADNLNNIVNGNFYPVIDKRQFNNNSYVVIKVDGQDYTVNVNRVKMVNVFTEAPKQ